MPGLSDAMAALMQQFGGAGGTVPGAMPSAYQTNQAAASVPSWSLGGATGNVPMSGPQSVPGMTAEPGAIMQALQNPATWTGSGQGGGLARQGVGMGLGAGATAALTPIMGPAATTVGPVVGQVLTSMIPHKGGGAPTAPPPQLTHSAPAGQIPDLGAGSMSGDQYQMLMQMLQSGNMRM